MQIQQQHIIQNILIFLEKYNVLNLKVIHVNTGDITITNRIRKLKKYPKYSKHASLKQHKVVILGDGHAKGYAAGVKHLLSSGFEVFGVYQPRSWNENHKGHG
jgi:hypothetical protein